MATTPLVLVITGLNNHAPTLKETEETEEFARAQIVITTDRTGRQCRFVKDNIGSPQLKHALRRALNTEEGYR